MAYDLVAISGPVRGARFPLGDGETVVGRTQRGVNLPDPLVSVRHCRIFEEKGTLFVQDLDSATGTFVNGQTIDGDVSLGPGDVIKVGESELRLDSRLSRTLRIVSWAMVPGWMLVAIAFGALWWVAGDSPTRLGLKHPINTGVGGRTDELVVPKSCIRTHGGDTTALSLRRVTDFDHNGLDELWLQTGEDEFAITFAGADLRMLGRFPIGCIDKPGGGDFPDLDCSGIHYRMMDVGYLGVGQTAPVVWIRGPVQGTWKAERREEEEPVKQKKKAKSEGDAPVDAQLRADEDAAWVNRFSEPAPLRVALENPDRLAGFLASRGVTRPVHYLLCEDAVGGLPAQAVLAGGEVVVLSKGCGRDVRFEGTRSAAFEGGRIAAIAFTDLGRTRLVEHLANTWIGAPDPAFLEGAEAQTAMVMGSWPRDVLGGLRLDFVAAPHIFSPIPSGLDLPEKVVLSGGPGGPPAVTATLLGPGKAVVEVPGCADAVVDVGRFRCALLRGCVSGRSFIEVAQTGCSADQVVLDAGYTPGLSQATSDQLEVRLRVEGSSGLGITDVNRAKVYLRPKP